MTRQILIKKLISEGFTTTTLSNMSDNEISLLSNRLFNESLNIKSTNTSEIENAKKSGQTFETYESELKEKVDNNISTKNKGEVKIGDKIKHKLTGAIIKITKKSGNDIEGKYIQLGKMEGKAKVGDIDKTTINLIGKTYEIIHNDKSESKESETNEAARTLGNQNRKGSLKGMKFKAGRPNFEKKDDEVFEINEVKNWVNGIVKNNYFPSATKKEIMEMIKLKLSEQEIDIDHDIDIDTDVEPGVGTPQRQDYPDPWKVPERNPNPDADPKFSKNKLPEFLKYDNILSAVSLNESVKNHNTKKLNINNEKKRK